VSSTYSTVDLKKKKKKQKKKKKEKKKETNKVVKFLYKS